jgi:hypothetical protein
MNPLASHRLLLPRLTEVNFIGAEGAKALAESLKPHKNPGGYWCHNQSLQELDLASESSSLPLFPCFSPLGLPLLIPINTHISLYEHRRCQSSQL